MKKLIIIAAAAENNALGKDNELVWHLPDDFKRFKELTSDHKIIMGRKTLESFPKPLPNRTHIAITRDEDYTPKFPCTVVHSISEAIGLVEDNETAFIIGGGKIYKQSMTIATDIELTRVHGTFEADAFFPEINEEQWEFTYLTYKRK